MKSIGLVLVCALLASSCSGGDPVGATSSTSSTATSAAATSTSTSSPTTSSVTSSTTAGSDPIDVTIADDDAPAFRILFSLAADGREITYQGDLTLTDFPLTGPQALAVDDDGAIWLADTEALRLVRFSEDGEVLLEVDTDGDGVGPILDIAPYDGGILGLEIVAALGRYRLVHYSADGRLLAAADIPTGYHLENGLSGIAVGPSDEIWIELEGGATVHEVTDLGSSPVVPRQVSGYRVDSTDLVPMDAVGGLARFGVGDHVVQVPFRQFGSLLYEGAVHGLVALLHSDVWFDDVIVVDDTVVLVDLDGNVVAEADYPLDELAYVAEERTAVAPDGRLIALLPRPDHLDVVSLTLYAPGHFLSGR